MYTTPIGLPGDPAPGGSTVPDLWISHVSCSHPGIKMSELASMPFRGKKIRRSISEKCRSFAKRTFALRTHPFL